MPPPTAATKPAKPPADTASLRSLETTQLLTKNHLVLASLHFTGLLLGISTFLIIGLFHPIVIKFYYWFGTRCWWWFLVLGIVALVASLLVEPIFPQTLLGVLAFSSFWTIKEIFEQRDRVARGWFPANPRRKN